MKGKVGNMGNMGKDIMQMVYDSESLIEYGM